MRKLFVFSLLIISQFIHAQIVHNDLLHESVLDAPLSFTEEGLLEVSTSTTYGGCQITLPSTEFLEMDLYALSITEAGQSIGCTAEAIFEDGSAGILGGITIAKGDGLFGSTAVELSADFDPLEWMGIPTNTCIEIGNTDELTSVSGPLYFDGDSLKIAAVGVDTGSEAVGEQGFYFYISFEEAVSLTDNADNSYEEVSELYFGLCEGLSMESLTEFTIMSDGLDYLIGDEATFVPEAEVYSVSPTVVTPEDTIIITGNNFWYVGELMLGDMPLQYIPITNDTIKAVVPYGATSNTLELGELSSEMITVIYSCEVPADLSTQQRKYYDYTGDIKGKLSLEWSPVPNDIFGAVIYQVQYKLQGDADWTEQSVDVTTFEILDIELKQIVDWRVSAICADGTAGEWSAVQSTAVTFDNEIYIYSEALMEAIGTCSYDTNLFEHLNAQDNLAAEDVISFEIDFMNGSALTDDDETGGGSNVTEDGDCFCSPVILEPTITRIPVSRTRTSYYYDYVNKWKTKRKHTNWVSYRHGAAQYRAAGVWSKNQGTWMYSFTAQDAEDIPSADCESRMLIRYVCLEGKLPADCACDKEVLIDGTMSSKVSVSGVLGTQPSWYKVSAQNTGVIVHYDDNTTDYEILGGYYNGVAINAEKNWNPTAFTNLAELAGSVATMVFAATGGTPPTPAQISDLVAQAGTAIITPFVLYSGQQGYDESVAAIDITKTIFISPNELNVIKAVSLGQIHAEGDSKKPGIWYGYPKYSTSYHLAAIFNPTNTNLPNECCIEKSAAYVCGSEGYAPYSKADSRALVGSILGAYQPWDGTVQVDALNNVIITSEAGYVHSYARCSPVINAGVNIGLVEVDPTTIDDDIYDPVIFDPNINESVSIIEWIDRTDNEAYFLVERSLDQWTGYEIIGEVEANTTHFIDENPDLTQTYYYRVTAINVDEEANDSPPSNVFMITGDESEGIGDGEVGTGLGDENSPFYSGGQLYPNPATHQLHLSFADEIISRNLSLTLMDMQGKLVAKQTIEDASTSLSVGELPRGVYFLKVSDEKGETHLAEKVILQ